MRVLFGCFVIFLCVTLGTGYSYAGFKDFMKKAGGAVLQEVGVETGKNPLEILNKHGFQSGFQLGKFREGIPVFSDWKYRDGYRNLTDFTEEAMYQKINAIYADIKDLKRDDFSEKGNDKTYAVKELFRFKEEVPTWLADRDKALKLLEAEKVKEREEKERIKLSRENAPQRLVELYKDTFRPAHFEQIKNAISLLPNWRVTVEYDPVNDIADSSKTFDLFDPTDGILINTAIILDSPPLEVDPSMEKPRVIASTINRKSGRSYVLAPYPYNPEYEALADIPKSVISGSGIGFKEQCFIVCKLTGLEEVQTLGGTKTVSRVKVVGLIPYAEKDQFIHYVIGNPDQFPPEKYVSLKVK